MSTLKNVVSLIVAAVVAVAGGVFIAPAAAAHGGPYELTVNSNGSGQFEVIAFYEEDGHVVEAIIDPVLEAESADGTTIGPISLVSSPEGRGRWVTKEPVLTDGDWSVTVSTTTPEEASVTLDVTVAPADVPPAPEPVEEQAEEPAEPVSTDADATEAAAAEDITNGFPLWAIVALAAGVVAGLGALVWRKRSVQ